MAIYHQPDEPVDLHIGPGQRVFHCEAFFDELEKPIHMDVAASDRQHAREQIVAFCRRTIGGVEGPPTVSVWELDDWVAR